MSTQAEVSSSSGKNASSSPTTKSARSTVARPFHHKLCQAWFAFLLLVLGSTCYLICSIIHLLPIQRQKKMASSARMAHVFFKLWLVLTPWIRFNWSKKMDWTKAFSEKGNTFILLNHSSFLDGFFATALLPFNRIGTVRTMIKAALLNIPLVGGICRACGHFPVYFTSESEGVFKVNPEKQAIVERDTKEHLQSAGNIVFFPEGQVSSTPDQLQIFRRGGFGMIKEYQANVWGLVMKGCPDIWPKGVSVGGFPGELQAELVQIFTTSEVASMSQEELCEQAQVRMQKVLNAMHGRA